MKSWPDSPIGRMVLAPPWLGRVRAPVRVWLRVRDALAGLALVLLTACSDGTVVMDNGTVSQWEGLEGRWVLVNFWAEWCAPCRREIPELNEIHAESAHTNVYVVGVNFDGITGDALADLKVEMGIEFPQLSEDPSARWERPGPTILPTTYVIDPAGELVEILVGPQSVETLMAVTSM